VGIGQYMELLTQRLPIGCHYQVRQSVKPIRRKPFLKITSQLEKIGQRTQTVNVIAMIHTTFGELAVRMVAENQDVPNPIESESE
jgi:hypothetical protein